MLLIFMDAISGKKMIVKKVLNGGSKVTARADSTGLENDQNQIVKHHHSVKKMQTPSVRNTAQLLMLPSQNNVGWLI